MGRLSPPAASQAARQAGDHDPRPLLGMVLKGYPRLSETFIASEIRLLEEQGLRLRIYSMRRPREDFAHDTVARIEAGVVYLPEDLIRGLPALLAANLRLALARPARYRAGLRLLLARLAATRTILTLKHFLQAGRLALDGLEHGPPAHLHAHFAHSPTSVAMFAAVLSGVPFSFTAHAKDIYTQDPERLRDKLGRAAFAVTCTGANLDYLARLNDGGTPIHRVYHGIDADYFTRSAPAPAPPPYRVLSVARLTPKKGLDTVLRALGLLRDRGLDLTFTLIGDGEERDRLRGLVRDLGLEGVTEWLGPQARDAVRERMAAAHVFALGCRVTDNGDRDGIPNVLAEAMAMELPVVATSVSAIPELVEPGRSGLLVPPDDPAAMAVALERALTDPALRARLARAGRDRVEREFDNRALIGGLAGLFKARLGSGAVSGEDPAGGQAERAGRQLAAAARPAWRP